MPPLVALIGRPNVGKSTLFNRMTRGHGAGGARAITEETPGVTRDRNYKTARFDGKEFVVVDTGGVLLSAPADDAPDTMSPLIRDQALKAVQEADLVIHLCDGIEGVTAGDREIGLLLRKLSKKTLLVVNKIDSAQTLDRAMEFYSLGHDRVIPVSALSGYGFRSLMETLVSELPLGAHQPGSSTSPDIPKVAVVGRPNVGKSTLINTLLSTERLLVTPIPGTTRDAIDTVCKYYGREYLFIDTAGIRKRVPRSTVEGFSVMRSLKSIERADVAVIVLDAAQGVVDQDRRIARMAGDSGKGVILVLNKWDLISDPAESLRRLTLDIRREMWSVGYAPILTVSGLAKTRVTKIFPLTDQIILEKRRRISTADLNKTLSEIVASGLLPDSKGKKVKAYYMTQTGVEPPSFVVFVNIPSAFNTALQKGFEKALRERYGFMGTPLRITFKSR